MIYRMQSLLIKTGRGFEDLNSPLRYLIFMRLWSPLLMKINFLTSDTDHLLRVTHNVLSCLWCIQIPEIGFTSMKHIFDLVDGWTQA